MTRPVDRVDERLKTWATEAQAEYVDAINQHGSLRAAARALGVNYFTVHQGLARLKASAAARGYSPEHDYTHPVPDTHIAKGVSTLYDENGKVRMQWVKSSLDDDKLQALRAAMIQALAEEVKGLSPLTRAPKRVEADLLALYPLGDPHFGMYAWAQESGDNFDIEIARRLTLAAVDRLVQTAPAASTAVLLPLGDIFHMDDQTNRTPGHGHQLDADGRFVKVLQVGIQTFRHAVLRCLEKHERVVVRFVAGNHDPHAVWALAHSIAAYFDNEPRVTVDLSPALHWFFRFGKVLIGATHGDKAGIRSCSA